jgi:hypothetical protein
MLVPASRSLLRALVVLLLAPTLVLSSLFVASPAQAQRIKPVFWGMHDNDWTTPPTVPVGSANFTTSGTYWPNIQTGPGEFDWARLTEQVEAAKAINAKPMIVLGQTPKFFSSEPDSADYDDYMPRIKPWRRYVTKVARKYGTRLDYQIWPEPNIEQNWKDSPRQMALLTMVASKAIKQNTGGRAKVVSPAVALRLKSQRDWTVKYFKQTVGGKRVHRYVDAIAIDPFPHQTGTPEDSLRLMRSIRSQLARIGVRKPFWNNEINYGVAGGGDTTTTTYSVDKQQSYVIRTFALSAAARMQRTYWLGWFRSPELAVHMTDSNGLRLPPAKSYEVVRSWLNKTNFGGCTRKKSGLWVCTAKKGRTEVRRIYWKPSGRIKIRTPRSTKRVENQEGGVDRRDGSRLVRVNFRPIMVASRK